MSLSEKRGGYVNLCEKRSGVLAIEFLFAFVFLLMFFLVIFTFQVIVLHRIEACYSVWRIERVESIDDPQDPNLKVTVNGGFGDVVIGTLNDSNISVVTLPDQSNIQSSAYKVSYNIDLIKGLLRFLMEKNSPEALTDTVEWIEPLPPELVVEHK